MTHFQNLLNRLDAVEHFLWILLGTLVLLTLAGNGGEDEVRFRVKADNNSAVAQQEKHQFVDSIRTEQLQGATIEHTLYPPKRTGLGITPQGIYPSVDYQLGDGRGDNFWCILVKNSCYDEKDVEEPKSFFVTLWKRWFSTDDDDSSPQDGDKISLQEG